MSEFLSTDIQSEEMCNENEFTDLGSNDSLKKSKLADANSFSVCINCFIYTVRKHIIIMTICGQCGGELPEMARFCPNCGAETRIRKDIFDIPSEGLISRVKELMHDVSVKRIIVKDDKGKVLLSIPVTWGTAGVIATVALAPWLAALGVIAALVAKCRVEVEREFDDKNSIDGNI